MMKSKITGTILILASIYYILAETICAITFNDTLINTYIHHTISELGIPNTASPLYMIMNTAFIIIGVALMFGNFYKFKEYIKTRKTIFYILTIIASTGVIIVGLIHGGNPLTSGYHTLGAVMAILGGNILLVLISQSMKDFDKYEKITLLLGLIGLVAFWIMFFNTKNSYMPVLERLSVYTLIIWSFITGLHVFQLK